MASPIALQSTTVFDQFCGARESGSTRTRNLKIRYQFESDQGSCERLNLVDIPGPEAANKISYIAPNTKYDNRVRRLQQGKVSSTGRTEYRGKVVTGRNLTPHQLPRIIGSLPGTAELCQTQSQYGNSDETGQCHSSDIYQQARRHTFPPVVSTGLTIWEWCLQRNIFLIAEHLPGKENVVADQESRLMNDRCDWMLNP